MLIPKILHFQWFSRPGQQCEPPIALIDTWRKLHPDFEIRIRRDVTGFPYPEQWALMKELNGWSDLARFWDLYDSGGVHVDTDVECLQRIPDYLMATECFASFENEISAPPGWIASCVMGSRKGGAFFKDIVGQLPKCDMSKLAVLELGPGIVTRTAKTHPELKLMPGRTWCPFHYQGTVAPGDSEVLGIHYWTGTKGVERDSAGRWINQPDWRRP